MKRIAMLALAVASVAFAGDYITAQFHQTGNGANGMTAAAPSAATDGVAAQSSSFSIASRNVATQAKVTIQSDQNNAFVGHATQAVMRGWRYTLAPDGGGNMTWIPDQSIDIFLDAGSVNATLGTSISFGAIPLPPSPPGTRFAWTGEQIHQATTLDAGIYVGVELFTP